MTLSSKLKGAAIGALLGKTGDRVIRAIDQVRHRGAPRRLDFYHDVADPWSHLAAQATLRLARAYPIELGVHVVTPPASDVDPEPQLRRKFALRDARDTALHLDLDFPPAKADAEPGAIRRANQIMIRKREPMAQLEAAIAVGGALWGADAKQLTLLMGSLGSEASLEVPPVINAAYAELRKRGFYQAGSWHWDGEWYAGVDRVPYLEAALAASTGEQPPPVLGRRNPLPPERLSVKGDRPTLDFWISFRSPYSYLALERAASLAEKFPIDLRVRPVLPLAMRGATPTRGKQLYIVRDSKREADRLGIPFGDICDPLGPGVEHAIAIAHVAGAKALDFIRSAMRGSWAEARDLASYVDLREIVERAGLDWAVAKAAMAGTAWREWAKTAADDLAVAGLWGVPSFRIGDYATWGQDRIDYLEDRLRRHFAAPAPAVTSDSA